MTCDLFGRHVRGRAENEPGLRQTTVIFHALGEPEVSDVRLVVVIKQDVRRFQIAVQDAAQVCIMHRPGHNAHQPGTRARVFFEPGYVPFEVTAADQLEADIGTAAVLAHLVDRHDMRMVQPGDGLGLDAKALNCIGTWPQKRPPGWIVLKSHDAA